MPLPHPRLVSVGRDSGIAEESMLGDEATLLAKLSCLLLIRSFSIFVISFWFCVSFSIFSSLHLYGIECEYVNLCVRVCVYLCACACVCGSIHAGKIAPASHRYSKTLRLIPDSPILMMICSSAIYVKRN